MNGKAPVAKKADSSDDSSEDEKPQVFSLYCTSKGFDTDLTASIQITLTGCQTPSRYLYTYSNDVNYGNEPTMILQILFVTTSELFS